MLKLYIFAALVAGGSASALVVESDAQADTFCSILGQTSPTTTHHTTLTCTDECYGFEEKIEYSYTITYLTIPYTLKFGAKAVAAPCASTAYITLSYEDGSTWTTIDTYKLPQTEYVAIPEATIGDFGGAYIKVTLSGSATSLTLALALSICTSLSDATGQTCDGSITGIGSTLTAAGFPIALFDKEFTDFSSICSANACAPPPGSSPSGDDDSDSGSGDSDSDSDDLALPLGLGLGLGLPVVGAASFLGYKKMKKGSLSGETPAVKMITDNQS